MDDDTKRERMLAFYEEMRVMIDKTGWGLVGVFPTESEDDDGYCFTYTVGGEWTLILHGMENEPAAHVLNNVMDKLDRTKPPVDGKVIQLYPDVPTSKVMLINVGMNHQANVARSFATDAIHMEAYQVLLMDDEGHWPWEPGVNPVYPRAMGVTPEAQDGIGTVTLTRYGVQFAPVLTQAYAPPGVDSPHD